MLWDGICVPCSFVIDLSFSPKPPRQESHAYVFTFWTTRLMTPSGLGRSGIKLQRNEKNSPSSHTGTRRLLADDNHLTAVRISEKDSGPRDHPTGDRNARPPQFEFSGVASSEFLQQTSFVAGNPLVTGKESNQQRDLSRAAIGPWRSPMADSGYGQTFARGHSSTFNPDSMLTPSSAPDPIKQTLS